MGQDKLEQLQLYAIQSLTEHTSVEINKTTAITFDKINSLHVAAYMDIEKTTKCLNNILAYKKEAAARMLLCSDPEIIKNYAAVIKWCDDTIKNVLGMNY